MSTGPLLPRPCPPHPPLPHTPMVAGITPYIECRKQRVFEGARVPSFSDLRRSSCILAGRREDTLHAGGGEEGRQILLGYLGELGPRRLLQLPVGEEVEVRVGLKRCRQVYSSSLSRSGVAAGAGAAAAFLPSSPASITVLQFAASTAGPA